MKAYVLDASVVICYIQEEDEKIGQKIARLFKEQKAGMVELLAPRLLLVEVGNGLRFSVDTQDQALAAYRVFSRLPLSYQEMTTEVCGQAISQAFQFNTTVYDTVYHVLAQSRSATLLTCDRAYFQKAKQVGSIELLETKH
ncbi:MAG: type II toxin-antitoxin system VapC family toxin [bacterium]|nr:type II toxin-antitoxin system VapC family toxin [bacterium]